MSYLSRMPPWYQRDPMNVSINMETEKIKLRSYVDSLLSRYVKQPQEIWQTFEETDLVSEAYGNNGILFVTKGHYPIMPQFNISTSSNAVSGPLNLTWGSSVFSIDIDIPANQTLEIYPNQTVVLNGTEVLYKAGYAQSDDSQTINLGKISENRELIQVLPKETCDRIFVEIGGMKGSPLDGIEFSIGILNPDNTFAPLEELIVSSDAISTYGGNSFIYELPFSIPDDIETYALRTRRTGEHNNDNYYTLCCSGITCDLKLLNWDGKQWSITTLDLYNSGWNTILPNLFLELGSPLVSGNYPTLEGTNSNVILNVSGTTFTGTARTVELDTIQTRSNALPVYPLKAIKICTEDGIVLKSVSFKEKDRQTCYMMNITKEEIESVLIPGSIDTFVQVNALPWKVFLQTEWYHFEFSKRKGFPATLSNTDPVYRLNEFLDIHAEGYSMFRRQYRTDILPYEYADTFPIGYPFADEQDFYLEKRLLEEYAGRSDACDQLYLYDTEKTPMTWNWDFGDGVGTSTEQNPTYKYSTNDTYPVTLTVTDENGSSTCVNQVTVNSASIIMPVASFTANTDVVETPLIIRFSDTSQNIPTTWSWDFGDGGTSNEQNPTYIYSEAGTYIVTLTVSNENGSSTCINNVAVDIPDTAPPAASFNTSKAGLIVSFFDTSVETPDRIIQLSCKLPGIHNIEIDVNNTDDETIINIIDVSTEKFVTTESYEYLNASNPFSSIKFKRDITENSEILDAKVIQYSETIANSINYLNIQGNYPRKGLLASEVFGYFGVFPTIKNMMDYTLVWNDGDTSNPQGTNIGKIYDVFAWGGDQFAPGVFQLNIPLPLPSNFNYQTSDEIVTTLNQSRTLGTTIIPNYETIINLDLGLSLNAPEIGIETAPMDMQLGVYLTGGNGSVDVFFPSFKVTTEIGINRFISIDASIGFSASVEVAKMISEEIIDFSAGLFKGTVLNSSGDIEVDQTIYSVNQDATSGVYQNVSGGSLYWYNANNISVANGSSYSATSTSWKQTGGLEAKGFGFNIPADAQITGIIVTWTQNAPQASNQPLGAGCILGTKKGSKTLAKSTTHGTKSYSVGSSSSTWGFTGLTGADINGNNLTFTLTLGDLVPKYNVTVYHPISIKIYYQLTTGTFTLPLPTLDSCNQWGSCTITSTDSTDLSYNILNGNQVLMSNLKSPFDLSKIPYVNTIKLQAILASRTPTISEIKIIQKDVIGE
jgi:PKD repeat protein